MSLHTVKITSYRKPRRLELTFVLQERKKIYPQFPHFLFVLLIFPVLFFYLFIFEKFVCKRGSFKSPLICTSHPNNNKKKKSRLVPWNPLPNIASESQLHQRKAPRTMKITARRKQNVSVRRPHTLVSSNRFNVSQESR